MPRYAMTIDLEKCMGCRACMVACKLENGTPAGHFFMYTYRFEEGEYPDTKFRYLPRPCMHCDNPPCVTACPVDSRIRWKNGMVLTDFDNCQGLRKCEAACPYGVNYFNVDEPMDNQYLNWELSEPAAGVKPPYWKPELEETYNWSQDAKKPDRRVAGAGHRKNTVGKCTFCVHRIEKGKATTGCQQACPVNAITFGDMDDSNSAVAQLLANRSYDVFRLKDKLGTNPKVFYLGTAPASSAHLVELVAVKTGIQANGSAEFRGGTVPWK